MNNECILVARHRREIKQLLDSARDRTRGTPTNGASSSSPSRTRRSSSKSDDESPKKSSPKRTGKAVQSFFKKSLNLIKTLIKILLISSIFLGGGYVVWKYGADLIPRQRSKLFAKFYLIIFFFFLVAISCSVLNAVSLFFCFLFQDFSMRLFQTQCEDMKPVIAAVRKQLQIRTGNILFTNRNIK
jgi:hypothetical protein